MCLFTFDFRSTLLFQELTFLLCRKVLWNKKIVIVICVWFKKKKKWFLKISVYKQHWRENFSVGFNQICNKLVNYRLIDAGKNFLKSLKINPIFGKKTPKTLVFNCLKKALTVVIKFGLKIALRVPLDLELETESLSK